MKKVFCIITLVLAGCSSSPSAEKTTYSKTWQQCFSDEECVDLKIGPSGEKALKGRCVKRQCQPVR